MNARVDKGKRWFKVILWLLLVSAAVKIVFALGHPKPGEKLAEAVILFLSGTIFFGGFAFFLGWLTGKQNGLSANDDSSDSFQNHPQAPVVVEADSLKEFNEDGAYAQAFKELESGDVEPAVWSRAFSETDGTESRARALYIKLRVDRLRKAVN